MESVERLGDDIGLFGIRHVDLPPTTDDGRRYGPRQTIMGKLPEFCTVELTTDRVRGGSVAFNCSCLLEIDESKTHSDSEHETKRFPCRNARRVRELA
jgi:hypothetical protein